MSHKKITALTDINPIRIKTIAVSGTKGGVGKSTVSVLLANHFLKEGKKVLLCDCDVECPNLHLLLGQELKEEKACPPKFVEGKVGRVYAEFPTLIKEKCTKCGLCAKVCKNHAIFAPKEKYPVFVKDLCSGCGACWTVCPFRAIEPKKEEIGRIYTNCLNSEIKHSFYLVTGVTNPGLEETGPVVRETKKFAIEFAEEKKADIILFDTAPGIHCPVINALLDVDLAFCVTEPTPMGAHDLDLILDLCYKLKIPATIILNQADLGDKREVQKVAQKFKIKIEKEIPYSKELVEAYSKGELIETQIQI